MNFGSQISVNKVEFYIACLKPFLTNFLVGVKS